MESNKLTKKILFLDIEATNLKADFGYLLCVGWRFLGQQKIHCPSLASWKTQHSKDPTDDYELAKEVHGVLSSADILVTYYGTRFDLPFLRTRFIYHQLPPIVHIPHVDLYYTARNTLLTSRRKLETVSAFVLGQTHKTRLDGPTWNRAAAGNLKAMRYIVKHCRMDVKDLQDTYMAMRPYIRSHPFVGADSGHCRWCGKEVSTIKQYYPTLTGQKQLVKCVSCKGEDIRNVRSKKCR